MFGYSWTERLTLWQAGPLADQPTNWFETIIAKLGIPDIMLVLGLGIIVCLVLETIDQRAIGKMAWVVAVFNAAQILAQKLAALAQK